MVGGGLAAVARCVGRLAASVVLAAAATAALLIVAGFCLLVFASGRAQEIAPELVERRLTVGMSCQEVERAIGEDMSRASRWAEPGANGGYIIQLSSAGWGSALAMQHSIRLGFDASGRLVGGDVEYAYRADERNAGLRLGLGSSASTATDSSATSPSTASDRRR